MSTLKRTIVSIAILSLSIYIGSMLFVVSKNNGNVYAESIQVVDVPREIELVVDNFLVFDKIPCRVTPSNFTNELEILTLDYKSKPTSSASFNNLTFKANSTGNFFLKFRVKNKYGNYLQDSIKIKVVKSLDSSTGYIKIISNTATTLQDSCVNLSEMVEVVNSAHIPTFYSQGNSLSSSFVTNVTGNHMLYAGIKESGYMKCVDISVYVKPKLDYSISIFDAYGNEVSTNSTQIVDLLDGFLMFTYEIKNGENQNIEIEISNDKCLCIESCDAPIINIKLLKKGECLIKFKHKEVSKEINIVVK